MVTSGVISQATISIARGNLLFKTCSRRYTKSKKNYLNWLTMSRFKCAWIYIHIVEIMVFLHTAVSITSNVENYLPCSHNRLPSSDMELALLESWAKNSLRLGPQSME
jgi:sensor histidine kinase YesM